MRISDWSSDVCSSDLAAGQGEGLLNVTDDVLDGLRHALSGGVDHQIGSDRRLVGRRDAGKLADLAGAGALVQPLGVTLLAGLHVGLDVNLVEDRKSTRLNSSH